MYFGSQRISFPPERVASAFNGALLCLDSDAWCIKFLCYSSDVCAIQCIMEATRTIKFYNRYYKIKLNGRVAMSLCTIISGSMNVLWYTSRHSFSNQKPES